MPHMAESTVRRGGPVVVEIDPADAGLWGGFLIGVATVLRVLFRSLGGIWTSPSGEIWRAMDRLRADLERQIKARDERIGRLEEENEKLEEDKRRLQNEVNLLNSTVARLIEHVPIEMRAAFNRGMTQDAAELEARGGVS